MDFFEQMEARIPHGEVRTRFAPSPTGYMHVGNLRTALYTWLIARRHHGKFILRIEDTDQGRLVEGAVDVIYKTMAECGLDHDEGPDVGGPVGPYIQSERRELFGKYAKLLCEKGGAYYCFCEKTESEEDSGDFDRPDDPCRTLSPEEAKAIVEGKGGFLRSKWCGSLECELAMKERAGVSSRCMPLVQSGTEGTCPVCGRKCTTDIYWGVAY